MSALRLYSSLLAGVAVVAASGTVCWLRSHRKTPDQREYERRQRLATGGRITDGTVLEFRELKEDGHAPLHFLLYAYDVGGVSYECSQDVTQLRPPMDLSNCRIGLPASVKYDPQNPANSIVVAEGWMGLRH
jgi:hypothetical protein